MCRARNQFGESEPLVHTIVVEDGRASSLPTIEAPDTADLGETVSTSCFCLTWQAMAIFCFAERLSSFWAFSIHDHDFDPQN